MHRSFNTVPSVVLALAVTLVAGHAAAQSNSTVMMQNESMRKQMGSAHQPSASDANKAPALPGAQTRADTAIRSNRPTSELSPNDALFDAINRGDIGDARDAMKRGAELGARNVLGLTPIDLSIDLSRNDITFLLLSLRGTTGSGSGPKLAMAGTGGAAGAGKPRTAASGHPSAATLVVAAQAPARRQYAVSSDPGTPAPQVGFLGFGGVQRP